MKNIFNKQLRNTCIDLQKEVIELELENDRLQYELSRLTKEFYSIKTKSKFRSDNNIEKGDLLSVVNTPRSQGELLCRVKDIYIRKRDNTIFYDVRFIYNNELSDSLVEEKWIKKVYKKFEVNNNEKI